MSKRWKNIGYMKHEGAVKEPSRNTGYNNWNKQFQWGLNSTKGGGKEKVSKLEG